MQTLQPSFPSYKGPLLHILAEWKGTPQPFGSAYSMAIGDTVTQGMIPAVRDLQQHIGNVAPGQMQLDDRQRQLVCCILMSFLHVHSLAIKVHASAKKHHSSVVKVFLYSPSDEQSLL